MLERLRIARATALAVTLVVTGTTTAALAGSLGPDEPARAVPATAPDQAITADGQITDLIRQGDKIYVKGAFRTVGTYSGSGMPVDAATGEQVPAPKADGQISVAVPDGAGGWYVGGDFRQIGDVETRGLAHLDASGTPDPGFTHRVDGLVSALDLHDGTLWFGGVFTHVDGTPRQHLAAISTGTGALTAFSAPQQWRVTEIAHAEAAGERPERVYVGTDRVVALDPATGATDETFESDLRGDVRSLLVDGDRLLVGGHGLVALDADTGAVDPTFGLPDERFPADMKGVVHTLLSADGRLYAGGDFGSLGGAAGPLVSLDPGTGLGDPAFAPSIGELTYASSDRGVFDLALAAGHLWVGGSFARVSDASAGNLVALDPDTGARLDLPAPTYDNGVNAVDASGSGLYVGGQYFMTNPVHSPGFAALDAETLLPLEEFEARSAYYFGDLIGGSEAIVLAATNFEGYDDSRSAARTKDYYTSYTSRLRAVDPDTGAPLAHLAMSIRNLSGVTTLGNELFVAQRLGNHVKFPVTRISVYSQTTGELERRFRLPQRGYVTELTSVGGNLLAVGSFRRVRENGQKAHLAAMEVGPQRGTLHSVFDLHTHGPIYDVDRVGDVVYVAGYFDGIRNGSQIERPGLAAFRRDDTGYAELAASFRPPTNLARSRIMQLIGLGDSVLVRTFGSVFLDARTGQRLPDAVDGYGPEVDTAIPDPAGVVYAATIGVPLAGKDTYYLSFVARAAG